MVLFEIFSTGETPWSGYSNQQVSEALRKKERLPLPENFGPNAIVELMKQCWEEDPHARPTFKVFNIFFFLN